MAADPQGTDAFLVDLRSHASRVGGAHGQALAAAADDLEKATVAYYALPVGVTPEASAAARDAMLASRKRAVDALAAAKGRREGVPAGMVTYRPDGETLRQFLMNRASRLLCIQGPVGSGKSTASAMFLFQLAVTQQPGPDGKRRTKFLVVRNTFNELKTTTIATWKALFPEGVYGKFYDTPPFKHEMRWADVECDVLFMAMDDEADRKKLLSLEITAAWVNEAREVPRAIISTLMERIGRYPRMIEGGPTRSCVVLDTNAPADDHWIPIMRGDVPPPAGLSEDERRALVKPDDWAFFNQPGGLAEVTDDEGNHVRFEPNPLAENTRFLPPGYYENAAKGRPVDECRISLCNQLGRMKAGKPVWPMFKPALHVAKQELLPVEGHPIQVGVDFGLTPAALMGQHINGRWLILDELVADSDAGMGAITFAPLLKRELASRFPGFRYSLTGDPAGDQRAQSDERTPFMIFRAAGLPILPASTNDFTVRKEAVESALNRLVNGYPGLLISPRCVRFRAAVEWGYRYAKLKTGGDRYSEAPVKDEHSHVADAGQYLLLGGGEGRMLLTGSAARKAPVNAKVAWSPHSRSRR